MRTLAVILFLLFVGINTAQACKCTELKPLSKESLDGYELIFSGKVAAVSACTEEGRGTVRFMIDSLFRGKAYVECDVQFDCSSSCAMSFAPGERWTIYATYLKYGSPEVILCSHSRKIPAFGTSDFVTDIRGASYSAEAQWLAKNLSIIPLNEEKNEIMKPRELIHPEGMSMIWLLGGGIIGVLILFFVLKRFLK
ncbi:MAG: hypothetical protein ACK5Z2_20635 [Bacteroidota bacterium]|jgi:hypothetical protein